MKNLYVFLLALLIPMGLLGQDNILKVDLGTDLSKIVDRQYLFSKFADGRVIYKNNSVAGGNLNYNMLLNELQFVQDGNTLAVANPNDIVKALIGKYTLINVGKGFALVIGQKDAKQLAAKVSITTKTPPKEGAYGTRSETTSITTYSQVGGQSSGVVTQLPVEVQVKNETTYYVVDEGKSKFATKKNFLKMFSKHKDDVEQYIKQNKTDFSDEANLEELFAYCVNL